MSSYTHRMTLVVPESLIPPANQLALIAGESVDDVNTFTRADYQDAVGNNYAVCSTAIKPIVLSLLGQAVADSPLQAEGADTEQAQQAMDAAVMYADGMTATPHTIVIAIDIQPMTVFESLGLASVAINDIDGIVQ